MHFLLTIAVMVLAVAVAKLYKDLGYLKKGSSTRPSISSSELSNEMNDVAERAVDRHVTDFHKRS